MADEDLDIPDLDTDSYDDQDQRPRRGRRILGLIVAFVLLTGAAFGGWLFYWEYLVPETEGELPVITADKAPMKVRPEEPGGMKIPNQDKLVYDASRETKPRVERLLPPPETPIAPPAPKAETAGARTPAAPRAGQPLPSRPGARSVALPPPLPAPGAAPAMVPPPARAPQVAAKPELAPALQPAPKPKAAMPTPAAPPAPKPDAVMSAPATTLAPPPAPKPEMAVKPAPAPPLPPARTPAAPKPQVAVAPPPPAAPGRYRVQLASLRSEETARREWSRLKRLHKDLLGDLELTLVRVEIPKKGVYHRVRIGPLADAEAARSLCANLALRKVGCLVVKP